MSKFDSFAENGLAETVRLKHASITVHPQICINIQLLHGISASSAAAHQSYSAVDHVTGR